jgi:hypothetical protein
MATIRININNIMTIVRVENTKSRNINNTMNIMRTPKIKTLGTQAPLLKHQEYLKIKKVNSKNKKHDNHHKGIRSKNVFKIMYLGGKRLSHFQKTCKKNFTIKFFVE